VGGAQGRVEEKERGKGKRRDVYLLMRTSVAAEHE
jgi:hypothetical protein